MDAPGDSFDTLFSVMLGVFVVFFVLVLGFMVVAAVKRKRAVENLGMDPFTADIEMAGRISQSAAFEPPRTTEQRLAELDDLLAKGTITQAEHDAARRKALGID